MRKRSHIRPEAEVKAVSFNRARGTGVCCKAREKKNKKLVLPKETLDKKKKIILTNFHDRILNSAILDLILSLQRQ